MNATILIHPRATNAELFRITRAGYKVVKVEGKRFSARGVPVKSLVRKAHDAIVKAMPWGAK